MMNILSTINSAYVNPLKVMLKSLFLNNSKEDFTVYVLHSSLRENEIHSLKAFIENHGNQLEAVQIPNEYFQDAPLLLHYTKEMYYRLLAFKFLPEGMQRILYLDPDLLVINSIKNLYETDLEGYLYAAAYHDLIPVKNINKVRLSTYDMEAYYNSGVLLMNLELQRKVIDEREIFEFINENHAKLFMPDQDVINALYAKQIKSLDEKLYNFDVRYYRYHKLLSGGNFDMDFIFKNTVILHFCGKKKPWQKNYSGKFHSLYKQYEKFTFSEEYDD